MKFFRCKACFYIHEGDYAPDSCPKCGAPAEQFELLTENVAGLIVRARKSNDLLMKSVKAFDELKTLANEGIKDNLDPACLNFYQRVSECSELLKKIAIAEIQSHVQKNKWG